MKRPEVVAIGASTGGIHALNLMLRELSPQFSLPILITQHLPSNFIPVFARQIEIASGRRTQIAEDGTEIRSGEIAIATGHGHMSVRRMGDRLVVRTLAEPATSGCLPSVDPMLSSLATACEGRVLAIILSGMGRDGFEGAQDLVNAGGTVWAQDADTSAVWGMPGAVTNGGLASLVAAPQILGQSISQQLSSAKGLPA
jgi:two-component system chemotaxis response regulator CheB